MRVTNANCNGDIDNDACYFSDSDLYGYGVGTFSDSDLYGYGYGNGDVHDSASNSNANSNSNGDAHAAAYPDAETGSDADAAPDSHAIALAAADATLIRIIQAGTREQNSRVLMTSLATNGASGRRLINVRPFPWGIDQTGHAHGDVRKIVLTHFCGFRYKSVLLSECREINPCR